MQLTIEKMQGIKLQVDMLLNYPVWWNLEASRMESLLFYSTIAVHYDCIPLAESRIQLYKRGNKQLLYFKISKEVVGSCNFP